MSEPFHGIRIVESAAGARPAGSYSQSVIYIVATAPDADADTFPLNEQTLLTNVRAAIPDAGTTGTLRAALIAIADQCEPFVIVMRVAIGADAAATQANVIGRDDLASYTGLQGARVSRQRFGMTPKIIGAPGLENAAVIAAGVSVAQAVRGMFYANAEGDNRDDAATFRDSFAARELRLLWPNVVRFDTATATNVDAPTSAYYIGVRARVDQEEGWHKTGSNVAINGIIGLSQDVSFDVLSPTNDAGFLSANDICTVVRNNGFHFWGNSTCSSDANFRFESAVRTAQVLHDIAADVLIAYIDKPLSAQILRDMIESMNARARSLIVAGRLIGGEYWIDPAQNSPSQLAAGQLRISSRYTPVPPIESITVEHTITDEYFFALTAAATA